MLAVAAQVQAITVVITDILTFMVDMVVMVDIGRTAEPTVVQVTVQVIMAVTAVLQVEVEEVVVLQVLKVLKEQQVLQVPQDHKAMLS